VDPQVSIITINFNDRSGLERTLNSVFSQTYTNWEQIVIDGGSTDGSANYLEEVSNKLAHWISESDNGRFHAMNKGISVANGDYLLFLHSGDVFTSEHALEDFVTHPDFNGNVIYGDYSFRDGGKEYPDKVSPDYFVRTSLPHQSTLFSRNVFKSCGNYDESYRISGDREWYLRAVISDRLSFTHIPMALTSFDLTGVSNDPSARKAKLAEDRRLISQHLGEEGVSRWDSIQRKKYLATSGRNTPAGIWNRVIKRIGLG
jgi:glycosyltransferase involved in cell wall biosynthesis